MKYKRDSSEVDVFLFPSNIESENMDHVMIPGWVVRAVYEDGCCYSDYLGEVFVKDEAGLITIYTPDNFKCTGYTPCPGPEGS